MDKWILRDAERYASAHRRKQRWYQVMTCLAAVVVFCTTYALILPAITLEKQCQIPEHTHTDSCYTQVTSREKSVLACEVEADAVIHKHDAACRDENGNLVCSLPELEAHRHTDSCYTIPEVHAHTDACYTRERGELTCTQSTEPRHTHTEACYQETSDLVCGTSVSTGHTHGADCFDNDGNPICGQEESQGHTHGEGCHQVSRQLICGQTEEPAHQHTDECYSWNQVLTCGQSTEAAQPVLTCEKDEIELHTHQPFVSEEDRGCYDAEGKNLVCGKPQVVEHQHTGACFKTVTEAVDTETLTCTLPEDETHTHTTLCYGTWELTCGLEEHTHSPACGSDPGADLETADIWEQTFAEVELTGDWQQDVLAIAGTQLGYTESTANYIVEDDGQGLRGYTRYGAWYGDPYGDWDAMFVSFCLHYAGVDEKFPLKADSASWVQLLSDEEYDLYVPASEDDPWPGDLIFFNREPELEEDAEPVADHVGLVAEVIPEEGDRPAQIKVIEGDASAEDGSPDAVRCVTYELNDPSILGYAVLPANPDEEAALLSSGGIPDTLYLNIDSIGWGNDGARIVLAYKSTENNGEWKFAKMSNESEKIYRIALPEDMDKTNSAFKFVRMKSGDSDSFTWNDKWNDAPSENLSLQQDKNCFKLTDWGAGQWEDSWYTPAGGTVTTLYLNIDSIGWGDDGARIVLAYKPNDSDNWKFAKMSNESEKIYRIALPEDMDKTNSAFKFVRMKSGDSDSFTWADKWNEAPSENLSLQQDKNCFKLTDWGAGQWEESWYTPAGSTVTTLYLDLSEFPDWEKGSATFYLKYNIGGTEKSVPLTKQGSETYYSVTIPADMDTSKSFRFERRNPDNMENVWDSTSDLTLPTDGSDCYVITGWKDSGYWKKTETGGTGSTVTTLYLDLSQFTTDGGWEKDGATFYLKYYNTSGNETSVRLTKKENEPYYSVTIPEDMDTAKSFRFERRSSDGSEVLHHTSDLTLPTNGSNRYIITDWTEGHWYGQEPGETRTVYYDATLSKLSYNGDKGTNTIPMANGNSEGDKVYCHWQNSTSEGNVQMTRDHDDVYRADIPKDAVNVFFYSSADGTAPDDGSNRTEDQVIPATPESPCFYGDTSDSAIYDSAKRSGYWGEVNTIRNAEAGKNSTVVDIASGTQTKSNDVLYVNTTLYDYYTDYELNGNNRDGYAKDGFDWKNSHRVYQPFRQFNQALSAYYQQNAAPHPLYWGNFQNFDGSRYNEISSTLNLYGSNNSNKFFAENNSMWGFDGNNVGNEGKQATQGLVDSTLSGGTLTMSGQAAPFFNEDFLSGSNAKKTVLGKVYHNVSFPFVKKDINNNGVDYWCFDSSQTNMANSNLQLQQDGSRYFLQPTNDPVNGYSTDSTAGPGYFPFNTSAQSGQEPRLNYGFGQRFDIQFRLTENGTVTDNAGNTKPIVFNFSGDDDVWVFVDGQLVLDIGGDHGRVKGSINFKDRNSTVSRVKNPGNGTTENVTTAFPGALQGSDFYSSEHTLTMFYMERGLWESNMEITFNFPDENALVVEKNVDTKNVNNLFSGLFNDVPFTFNIRTMATHYGTTSSSSAGSGVGFMSQNEIRDYGTAESGVLAVPKGATYITSSNSNEKTIGEDGSFTLKNGERAVFQNQFRRGSYMYLEEQSGDVQSLFTTSWSMFEGVSEAPVETSAVPSGSKTVSDGGQSMTGFGSYVVTDGRTEIQGPLAGDDDDTSAHGENKYRDGNASVPENAFVFRHYSNPDSTIGTTKLTVKFTNTVKTGSLTITKAQAEGSEDLGTQEFTFYVTFRNVGGKNLEETASIQTDSFTLKVGDSKTIEGIPVGTEFIIHEVKPEGGEIVLDNVNGISPGTGTVNDSATYTVTGSIPADGTEQSYTFYNSKLPTVSLTVRKEWKTAMGATMIQGLPQSIKVRLQRSSDGNIWETVSGYAVVTLTPEDSTRWDSYSYTFQNLPRYTNSTGYRYRVVELDSSEYEVDGSVTIGDKVFTVTYSDVINSSENGAPPAYSQTITNKEQPTGYELPDTGGAGTIPYTIGGFLLLTGAAFLLLYNHTKRRKEDSASS